MRVNVGAIAAQQETAAPARTPCGSSGSTGRRRTWVSSCMGFIGWKGSQAEAPRIEKTLPRLPLAAILMYLDVLP